MMQYHLKGRVYPYGNGNCHSDLKRRIGMGWKIGLSYAHWKTDGMRVYWMRYTLRCIERCLSDCGREARFQVVFLSGVADFMC